MQLRNSMLVLYAMIGVMAIPLSADAEQKRIEPGRVTIKNHEQFMAQFRRDFPAGTPAQEVMAYLDEKKIEFAYIPPGALKSYEVPSTVEADGYDHRVGYIGYIIRKISNFFFMFRTDLQVKVYVSKEEKVIDIRHRLVGTGP